MHPTPLKIIEELTEAVFCLLSEEPEKTAVTNAKANSAGSSVPASRNFGEGYTDTQTYRQQGDLISPRLFFEVTKLG
jgi:hypothetical protein